MRFAIARGDDDERAAREVGSVRSFELATDVRGDAHDVLHHGHGILEHAFVDLLMDVANARAALIIRGGIGFVDVSDLERLGVLDLAVDLEVARDFLKLFFLIGHKIVGCAWAIVNGQPIPGNGKALVNIPSLRESQVVVLASWVEAGLINQQMQATLPLDKMTKEEKLRAMEELWADLSRDEAQVQSPAWHGEVLHDRAEAVKSGKEVFMDWEAAKKQLRDRQE